MSANMRHFMNKMHMAVTAHVHDVDNGLGDLAWHSHLGELLSSHIVNIELGLSDIVPVTAVHRRSLGIEGLHS